MKTTIFIASLLFVAGASAEPIIETGTVTLVSADGPTVDGFVVSPYNITFNGQNYSAFCIDFQDDVTVGQSWTANEYSGAGLIYARFPVADYEAEYWLVQQETPANQIPTQLAMWGLTDPTFPDATAASVSLLAEALSDASTVNPFNFAVLTPTVAGDGQEFVILPDTPAVVVSASPEPAAAMLIGIGLIGLGFLKRKA